MSLFAQDFKNYPVSSAKLKLQQHEKEQMTHWQELSFLTSLQKLTSI